MNIESTGVIESHHGGYENGPMCPHSIPPNVHPSHEAALLVQNAVYEAIARDEDGEPATEELGAVSHASSYSSSTGNRMRLYRATELARSSSPWGVVVESLYFRCRICGFVLPASRAPESR